MWDCLETAIILLPDFDPLVQEFAFEVITGTRPAQLLASVATRQSLVALQWSVRSRSDLHELVFTLTRRCLQELQARSAQPDASTFPVVSMQKWVIVKPYEGQAKATGCKSIGRAADGVVVRKCP